ncbi:hypothetical protein LTR85_012046 [Meristemomyces frigidus]|nr:hypothetical protein LTR85_012046 [Meristemomyces frigidus]
MEMMRATMEDSSLLPIMQHAVKNHFDPHPEEYAQCPGPNCAAYYKLHESGDQNICPSCFAVTCVGCKVEQHFGETCRQYQERVTGQLRALEEWMLKHGAKRCKRCNTIVEKLDGCNNMQCPGCKADFCFTCMEILPTHEEVYTHLIVEHRNYGDEEALELEDQVERAYQPRVPHAYYGEWLDPEELALGRRLALGLPAVPMAEGPHARLAAPEGRLMEQLRA